MEIMNLEEMKAKALELFGPDARVYYSDHQWVIETGVGERFDEDKYRDRAAWELYDSWEYGENQLERWARKNGHGSESYAELFDSYDEEQEHNARRIVEEVRGYIEQGLDFDAAGLADWRDRVLAYAEEKGW